VQEQLKRSGWCTLTCRARETRSFPRFPSGRYDSFLSFIYATLYTPSSLRAMVPLFLSSHFINQSLGSSFYRLQYTNIEGLSLSHTLEIT
jgi:hypothetical protein